MPIEGHWAFLLLAHLKNWKAEKSLPTSLFFLERKKSGLTWKIGKPRSKTWKIGKPRNITWKIGTWKIGKLLKKDPGKTARSNPELKVAYQVEYGYVKACKSEFFWKNYATSYKNYSPFIQNPTDSGLFFPINLCHLVSWKNSP